MGVDFAKLTTDVLTGFDQVATTGGSTGVALSIRKHLVGTYSPSSQSQFVGDTDYVVPKYIRSASRISGVGGNSGAGVRVQEIEVLVGVADLVAAGWSSASTPPDENCSLVFDPSGTPVQFRIVSVERQVGESLWRIVARKG